jgi:AcrR family transcriptional regulator
MNNDRATDNLTRKEREFIRHRSEILDAAEEVFSEKGYISATMEEIAAKAEFAVGTLYKFFNNKANLYRETVLTRLQEMEQQVYEILDSDLNSVGKLEKYFRIRIDLFWENPRFFRIFFGGPVGTITDTNLGYLPEILERYQALTQRITQILELGISNELIKPFNPKTMTLALEGLLRVYIEKLCRESRPVRSRLEEEQLFQIFLRGTAQ